MPPCGRRVDAGGSTITLTGAAGGMHLPTCTCVVSRISVRIGRRRCGSTPRLWLRTSAPRCDWPRWTAQTQTARSCACRTTSKRTPPSSSLHQSTVSTHTSSQRMPCQVVWRDVFCCTGGCYRWQAIGHQRRSCWRLLDYVTRYGRVLTCGPHDLAVCPAGWGSRSLILLVASLRVDCSCVCLC